MSFSYDGGQRSHGGGGGGRRDDTPRDWTPEERAEHAKNTASNVTRSAAEVTAAVDRMKAAAAPAEHAAAKKDADLAIAALRTAATAAATAVAQATAPEVVQVLAGAGAQLETAEGLVKAAEVAAPVPTTADAAPSPRLAAFIAALPPEGGPRVRDSAAVRHTLIEALQPLEFFDIDPLVGELQATQPVTEHGRRAQFLSEETRKALVTEMSTKTFRKGRLVAAGKSPPPAPGGSSEAIAAAPHAETDQPAPPASDAAAPTPVSDSTDPLHALANRARAVLGIEPRLLGGEAGRAATEARGARGVAHGDTIAIHPDVDATTQTGKQAVFHEYYHQAQAQLPGAAPETRGAAEAEAAAAAEQFADTGAVAMPQVPIDLAQPAADKDAERNVAADRIAESNIAQAVAANRPVTAQDYLRGHLNDHVLPAITRRVSAKRYPLPDRARWNAHAHPFGVDVMAQVHELFETDPYFGLPAMLAHASPDLWTIIDTHRGMHAAKTLGAVMPARGAVDEAGAPGVGAKGSAGWNPTIGDLIAKAFDDLVAEAVLALSRRYVAAHDAAAADTDASHGTRERREVGYPEMTPGNALERIVGHALADGHLAVDATAAPAPRAAAATKEVTLAAAAERVIERADATYAALERAHGNPTPPPQLASLEDALRDLADVLHHHAGKQRDREAATLDRAQQKTELVMHQLASKLGPRSPAQTALRNYMNLVWSVVDDNRAGDGTTDPVELAAIAHENLTQLEAARTLIEAAQAQTADVSVVGLTPAITTTRTWVTQLADGAGRAAAGQLERAILDQEDLVLTVDVELREVFREPLTPSWAATVNAYASVLGRSTEPRQRVAASLEHARRMRRGLKIEQLRAALIDGRDQAATLHDLDSAKGEQAGGSQALLAAKAEAYEATIAAGGTVPASELDELLLVARERAFANRLEVLRQMAAQTRSAVNHLRNDNPLKPLAVRLIERKILEGLTPKLDGLVADLDETRHAYEAWAQPNATDIPPSQHRARRRDAVAGMEVRLQETLVKGRYQAILEEARRKLIDATDVEIGSVLIETIAMTMVGNFAGMAARGGAEGLVLGRAAANAERTAAAMEAAGAAEAAIEAQEAATLLRTGATASRLGAVAGHVAEGVFNSLTQKYLQGDESSLAALVFVNVGTSAALEKLLGSLQALRHPEEAVDGVLKKLPRDIKAARAGIWLAKAGTTLTAEVVAGAAVDYALSRIAGRKTNPPSDQTVADWLIQGGMQAVGKHISHNVDAVKHSLEALHLTAGERGAQLAAYGDGLAVEARLLAQAKGTGASADILERYNELLRRHAELLDRQLMAAVESGDDARRKQVLTMVRANNREATALRDLATQSFEAGDHHQAAAKPRPVADDAGPARAEPAVEPQAAADPYYDRKRGIIVGDPNRLDEATLARLMDEQAAHMRELAVDAASDLGVDSAQVEIVLDADVSVSIEPGRVRLGYSPKVTPEQARGTWKAQAKSGKGGANGAKPPRGGNGAAGAAGGSGDRRAALAAKVEEVGISATVLAAGSHHHGGGDFAVEVPGGQQKPVKVTIGDDSIKAARVHLDTDHYRVELPPHLADNEVEVVLAGKLAEIAHTETRRATGQVEASTDALGAGGKGTAFSPKDFGMLAELRALRRQRLEAQVQQAPDAAARIAEIDEQIRAQEKVMGFEEPDRGPALRQMSEVQVELENDALRRESERKRLDGIRGHSGFEFHTHWMGIVDVEVFRAKAAIAARGKDDGSWIPLIEAIASTKLGHEAGDSGPITKRKPAGDAHRIATEAARGIEKIQAALDDANLDPAMREKLTAEAEAIAEKAARTALVATNETDFNSSYEVRDELIKDTWAGKKPHTGNELADDQKAANDDHANRGYDDYTKEALLALAHDGIEYTEPSNSHGKMAKRFPPDRVAKAMEELVASGQLKPGQIDLRFLTMTTTNHFGERRPGEPSIAVGESSEEAWSYDRSQIQKQLLLKYVGGIDIAGQEFFWFDPDIGGGRLRQLYADLIGAATQRGERLVLRPHVGEGAVDTKDGKPYNRDDDRYRDGDGNLSHYERAKHNIDAVLTALEDLKSRGLLDPTKVDVRFGHATHATPEQAIRMKALGITAEVNLGSNVVTGSLDQTRGVDGKPRTPEQFDDHALPTLLYYDTGVVLSTDAHSVMSTDMRSEYTRARRLIDEVLSGGRRVRVRAADAGDRGTVKPNDPDGRWLAIHEMTAEERQRFTHAYEKLYADATRQFEGRPGAANAVGGTADAAATPRGSHATDLALEHGLVSRHGDRVFEGSPEAVAAAAAAYRNAQYVVLEEHAPDGRVTVRVRSDRGDVELELRHIPDTQAYRDMPVSARQDRTLDRDQTRDAYNSKVKHILELDAAYEADGVPLEERARRAYEYRHRAREWAREQTERPGDPSSLEVRDVNTHGNPDGPSFEDLVAKNLKKGMSQDEAYRAIIKSSARTNQKFNDKYGKAGGAK